MGWFSADEVITTAANNNSEKHSTAQTVALCILAAVAIGYVVIKCSTATTTVVLKE